MTFPKIINRLLVIDFPGNQIAGTLKKSKVAVTAIKLISTSSMKPKN